MFLPVALRNIGFVSEQGRGDTAIVGEIRGSEAL